MTTSSLTSSASSSGASSASASASTLMPSSASPTTSFRGNNNHFNLGFGGAARRSDAMTTSTSMRLTAPKKKMTIKPFKKTPKLPDDFEATTWNKLHAAIVAVQTKQKTEFSREELYRSVEDLCTLKKAESLYQKLEQSCGSFVRQSVLQLEDCTSDPSAYLEAVHDVWQKHCEDLLVIRTIFLYLDRTYVIQAPNVVSIWDMGLNLLRESLTSRQKVESKLIDSLLDQIEKERHGEEINRSHVYNLLRMLSALQLYHSRFEAPFLVASEVFYSKEGVALLENSTVAHFLAHVDRRLREENDRVIHYLDGSTKRALIAVVENKLLKPHSALLLEKGFEALVDANKLEDLKRMYTLYGRIDGLGDLKNCWVASIKKKVSALVMDVEQEKNLVEKLLQLKTEYDAILQDAFLNNAEFQFGLKNAMEYAINVRTSRPAELVAKFIDAQLRTGNKGGSETEVENLLDRVMVIFRYIQGKDVFEAFYKKDLAKRLLLGKSASFDLEKLMLSKLKTECGSSFTTKLEGMFKDIDLSQNVMAQFAQHAASRAALDRLDHKIDVQVQVLTTGFWPPYAAMEVNLPSGLVALQKIFEQFYSSKYQGRQLQWQHSLGHCTLKATFPKGKKELAVSLYQALVLLCFNDGTNRMNYKEVEASTRIEPDELKRVLQSLACAKVRVLTKIPKGRDINESDAFEFNEQFSHQLFRIKINSIQMKETKQENEETHERVFRDRQYQVDAAIVRIMKARKKLSHALLMSEIFAQIRFPAKPADIKRRIESLIDREYLERDPTNAQVYNYLA